MVEIDTEALHPIYKELSNIVGVENMEKMYRYYRGQQLNFPSRLYSKTYIRSVLKEQYNGTNIKALARVLGYSERWIRVMLKDIFI